MVAVSKDVDWPMVGDVVTLEATSLSGDRARFKLTSKPYDSALELFDAGEENYIEQVGEKRCRITPDVSGYYSVTAVDENVTTNVKKFSNDGGTGLSKGIETVSAVASTAFRLDVGAVLTREFGYAQDKATLTVKAHYNSPYDGILTYTAGKGYTATLGSATTPMAELAIQTTSVAKILGYYGMSSAYADSFVVAQYSKVYESPATQLRRVAVGFNYHIETSSAAVHDHTDTTNRVTATACTTEPTLITYTNGFRTKYGAHLALGTGAAHPNGADTTNTLTIGTCSSKETARLLAINIKNKYNGHKTDAGSHYAVGDCDKDSLPPWWDPCQGDSTSTVCSYVVALAGAWNNHVINVDTHAGYHAATGSVNAMQTWTGAVGDEVTELVNESIAKFEAHCANLVEETGSSVSFHSTPDKAGVVPFRASDRQTTIEAIDYLHWAYLNHVMYGASGHEFGVGYALPSCACTRIQHAMLDRLRGVDTTTPPNTMVGVANLISLGGFTK